MNYGIVLKVLGNLLLFEAIVLVAPLLVAVYAKEPDVKAFVYAILILLIIGLPMSRVPNPPKKN